MEGEGIHIWSNKRKYVGSYHKGLKEGFGTYYW